MFNSKISTEHKTQKFTVHVYNYTLHNVHQNMENAYKQFT